MKLLIIFGSVFVISSAVMIGLGSYGLDPRILSGGTQFSGDGFHGTHSARLEYQDRSNYIKIDVEDPLSFEELDEFIIYVKPFTENVSIKIELVFDADNDGKQDFKLYAAPFQWEQISWPTDQWTCIDAFDFKYSNLSRKKMPENSMNLDQWQEESDHSLKLLRIYVCGVLKLFRGPLDSISFELFI